MLAVQRNLQGDAEVETGTRIEDELESVAQKTARTRREQHKLYKI